MDAAALSRPAASRHALTVAALLAWLSPAAAADFQLDNLKFDFGALVISVPKVEVKGSTLEREAFAALFSTTSGESAVSRIGKLNASEISAPELKMEQTIGPQKQVTVYRSVRFSEVRDGKIGRGEAAGGSVSANLPPEASAPAATPGGALSSATKAVGGNAAAGQAMRGEFLKMSFDAFDLKQLARVMTEKAKPGVAEPMVPVIGRYELDGYNFDLGPLGKMSLGKNSGRGFSAKVGDEPLGEVFTKLAAMSEKAAKEPGAKPPGFKTEEERKLGLSMLSLFETVSYGSGEARDFVMTMTAPPKPDAKPAPGAKPEMVDFRINRIAFGEDTAAKSGFAIEGMSFAGGGAKGQIDLISHSGFAIGPVIAALKDELAKVGGDFDSIDFRRFVPTIGTIRFSGIAIDAPQEAKRGGPPNPAPIKVGIGVFELKSGEQLNGIPTSLSLTIDNLLAPVIETPGNPTARDLLAMGYRTIDFSGKLDLAWDAAKSEIGIKALSLGGAGMMRFDAKGTLGNVTKDLFASDMALAQVAALGATARSVEAKLQNLGLFEKLLENEARKAKRKPEEMRQQYAMMANLGLSAILGPSEGAKALTAALSRFIAKPGTLTVSATAKSASGLGLADVITLTDPTEIFDKIDIKANAE